MNGNWIFAHNFVYHSRMNNRSSFLCVLVLLSFCISCTPADVARSQCRQGQGFCQGRCQDHKGSFHHCVSSQEECNKLCKFCEDLKTPLEYCIYEAFENDL